jgi:antirestriction protein ArdC
MKNNNITESIYEEITQRIIDRLKEGKIPWQQPWTSTGYNGGITAPINIVSKKRYKGINAIMLGTAGFASPYWMTYKQAAELGGNVKKGSASQMVVFFKRFDKTDKEGNPVINAKGEQESVWMIRYSRVFNLEQTEGIESPDKVEVVEGDAAEEAETDGIKKAKQVVKDADLCPIKNGGDRAAYSPALDMIKMPAIKSFKTPASYYHTLFHEMTHATGNQSRLARFETGKDGFGSEGYSKEELVAELGASFLSNHCGILCDVQFTQAAGYIQHWISALKNDHKLIVQAASAAQKATDLILHN